MKPKCICPEHSTDESCPVCVRNETTSTDTQLKQALAKMLPEKAIWSGEESGLFWKDRTLGNEVLDTELLRLCQMVLRQLSVKQRCHYDNYTLSLHDEWQWHVAALAKVLGVEVEIV